MSRVEVDPDVLFNAINDAINVYVREVLIPRWLVNGQEYSNDRELVALKHGIARHWAEHWKVSWRNEDRDPIGG